MSCYTHRNTTAQNMNQRRQPAWMSAPASEGRVRFVQNLLAERQATPDFAERTRAHIVNGTLTSGMAIAAIEYLKLQNRIAVDDFVAVTEEGFYFFDGQVYRVVTGKTSGRLYAKLVTAHGWDYEAGKGMMRRLTAEMKMTVEAVRQAGLAAGVCCNCSAGLSDPISQEIGFGTKCGPDLMGRPVYNAARKAAKLVPHVAEALAAIKARKEAEKAGQEVAAA